MPTSHLSIKDSTLGYQQKWVLCLGMEFLTAGMAPIYLRTEFFTTGMGVMSWDGFSNGSQPPRLVVYKLLHPSLFFFLSSICRSTNKDWVIPSGAHWIILIGICIYLQGFSLEAATNMHRTVSFPVTRIIWMPWLLFVI